LTANLVDGSSITKKVLVNRGGPDNPLSDQELALKFSSNALRTISQAQAAKISEVVFGFPTNLTSLADLTQLLTDI
jgi:hypothetical protein